MIQLGDTLLSEDILEKEFVCNLSKCKGACCVEGDAGAPLEDDEAKILERIFGDLKPYLRKEGIQSIKENGTWIVGDDGEKETPLVAGKECAYVVFDEQGITKCGIEQAWADGKVDFRKPVSCHLYPIRIKQYSTFSAVNYHKWPICSDACTLGKELQVPVYKFVKDALIRKYGSEWYLELETIANSWQNP